jgi:hypothetical protein
MASTNVFSSQFKDAVTRFIEKRVSHGVAEIINWTEDQPSPYYCETCGPDSVEVNISYKDTSGEQRLYTYYGGFGELVSELCDG